MGRLIPLLTAAFTPRDIPDLKLWLAADRLNLAEGDAVGTWADLSGKGYDATQATAARKPVYKAAIVNSRPVVRFDGFDDYLANSAFALGTTISVLAVAAHGGTPGTRHIITNELNFFFGVGPEADFQFASFYGNGAVWGSPAGHGADAALTANTFYVLTSVLDATNDNPFVNGVDVGARANAMSAFSNGYEIGRAQGLEVQFWNKDIAEIVIYDRALPTAQRQRVERYLGAKYGISVS